MIRIKATPKWVCKILKLPFTKVTYRRTPNFLVPEKTATSLVNKGYATFFNEPTPEPDNNPPTILPNIGRGKRKSIDKSSTSSNTNLGKGGSNLPDTNLGDGDSNLPDTNLGDGDSNLPDSDATA